jgi:hypothetical protein
MLGMRLRALFRRNRRTDFIAVHKLRRWCFCHRWRCGLRSLCSRQLPGRHWRNNLRPLCHWKICSCASFKRMHQLPPRIFSGCVGRCLLLGVFCGAVHSAIWRNRVHGLRRGDVYRRLRCNRVYHLPNRKVLLSIERICVVSVLELCCRGLFGSWIHRVHTLFTWFIFSQYWAGWVFAMRCRRVFSRGSRHMLSLPPWQVPRQQWAVGLLDMRCRRVFCFFGVVVMRELPCRVVPNGYRNQFMRTV